MPERPLQHRDPDKKDDETLRKESRAHFASEPALQLVAELVARLRELDLPWWSPVRLRERWGAVERMRWLRERADLRQRVTSSLTGLAPKAARKKAPDFQGALLDSVIDDGDVSVRVFEEQFQPFEIAVYGPAGAYWNFFRESLPWEQDTQVHHELMTWLFKSLLTDRSPFDGIGRTPILTPWDVRTAIEGRVWHTRIPLEVRVAIDEARLQQERDRPGVPFHAEGDLSIAVPEIIATSIPLRDLIPVLNAAQKSMRFEAPRPKIEGTASEASHRPPEIGAAPGAAHPAGSAGSAVGVQAPVSTPPPPLSSGPPTLAGGPPGMVSNPFPEGSRGGGPPGSPPPSSRGGSFDQGPGKPATMQPLDPGPGQDFRGGMPVSKPGGSVPPGLHTATTIPAPPMIQMAGAPSSSGPPGSGIPSSPGPSSAGPGAGGFAGPGAGPGAAGAPGIAGSPPPAGPVGQGGPPPSSGPPGMAGPPPSAGAPAFAGPPPSAGPPASAGPPPSAGPPASAGPPTSAGVGLNAISIMEGLSSGSPAPVSSPGAIAPPAMVDPGRGAPPPSEPKSGAPSGVRTSTSGRSGGSSGLLALLNSIDAEDEMEMTNPYSVPSAEEIAAESARLPPSPDDSSGKRRKA